MTKFLKYTTEWIGRTTIFCNDKIPQIYYRMDWQDYHIFNDKIPQIYYRTGLVGLPYFVMDKISSNILPNRLVGLPYIVMTKFLKYTTEQISRTAIYCNDKSPQIWHTERIGRTTIFCYDNIPQIYHRMDWQDCHIL